MTFIEKFEYLKQKYGKAPNLDKLNDSFAAQIEMTDDDCHGIFYVAYMNGIIRVEPYDYHDNTVCLKLSSEVLEDMLNGKISAIDAYNNGLVLAAGNLGHALQLVDVLKIVKANEEVAEKSTVAVKKQEEQKSSTKTEKTSSDLANKTTKTAKETQKAGKKCDKKVCANSQKKSAGKATAHKKTAAE